MPLAARMGITRVAVLTGLDVIGIPVVAAYRPNSRSVAVHQGKGTTLAAAKASAVMEAVEIVSRREHRRLTSGWHRTDELPAAVAPERLPCGWPRTDVCSQNERLLWIAGQDLIGGGTRRVPFELVSADFTWPGLPGGRRFQATTNGLASGNHLLEAVLHGLYKVVERDAMALWQVAPILAQEATVLDPDSVTGPIADACWNISRRRRSRCASGMSASDVGLPAFSVHGGIGAMPPRASSRSLAPAAMPRRHRAVPRVDRGGAGAADRADLRRARRYCRCGLRPGDAPSVGSGLALAARAPRRRLRTVPSRPGDAATTTWTEGPGAPAPRGVRQAAWVDLSRAGDRHSRGSGYRAGY